MPFHPAIFLDASKLTENPLVTAVLTTEEFYNAQIKSRGVNREKCEAIEAQLVNAAIDLNAMHVKVGLADIDDLSAIASEFNVRKRMLPVALLFKTRARDGDKLKADLFASPPEVCKLLTC